MAQELKEVTSVNEKEDPMERIPLSKIWCELVVK